jgi:hypothetical protein
LAENPSAEATVVLGNNVVVNKINQTRRKLDRTSHTVISEIVWFPVLGGGGI